jgi:hypothetical protein
MSGSSGTRAGLMSQDGTVSEKPAPNPVKLEKLPPTFRLPRTNLELPA